MKKIIEILSNSSSKYTSFHVSKIGGNGIYCNIPEIDMLFLEIDTTDDIINDFEKYLSRCRKYHIEKRFVYSPVLCSYFYRIAIKKEYEKMSEIAQLDKQKNDAFWQIYHDNGKQAAEKFYEENKLN